MRCADCGTATRSRAHCRWPCSLFGYAGLMGRVVSRCRVVERRFDAEGADRRAMVRAWLANLPPDLASIYEDLKRLDPKGQPSGK